MVRKFGWTVIITFTLLFIQGSVIRPIVPQYFMPNLLVVLVVYFALHEVSPWGALQVFIAGLLYDLSTVLYIGPWAGAFVLTFAAMMVIFKRLFVQALPVLGLGLVVASVIASISYAFLLGELTSWTWFVVYQRLAESLATAITGTLLFPLLKFVMSISGPTVDRGGDSRLVPSHGTF